MQAADEDGRSDRAHNYEHSASFYFLMGFSTELMLKVIYMIYGGKKPVATFGHDLRKIFEANCQLGWQPHPQALEWLVDAQQEAHKKFWHRYDTAPSEQLVPDIKEAVQILWDLAKKTEANHPNIWKN